MFNIEHAITEWRRQMAAGGINNPEVLNELESHLRDDLEHHISRGLTDEDAFAAAVERIGKAGALHKEFKKAGKRQWSLMRALKSLLLGSRVAALSPSSGFDANAKQALEVAPGEALRFHHDFIGTEHILLGLLQADDGIVSNVLRRHGVERESIRKEIEKLVGVGFDNTGTVAEQYTPRAKKSLVIAANEAKSLNHAWVGAEHIFLGLLIEGEGVAALVLKNLGVQVGRTRTEILNELSRKSI